jgi:hypothetical protein
VSSESEEISKRERELVRPTAWRSKVIKGLPYTEYVLAYRRYGALPNARRKALAPIEAWMAERQINWSKPVSEALRRLGIYRPSIGNYIFKMRAGMTPLPDGFLETLCEVLHVPQEERAALVGSVVEAASSAETSDDSAEDWTVA